jgi:hypothetical protein
MSWEIEKELKLFCGPKGDNSFEFQCNKHVSLLKITKYP